MPHEPVAVLHGDGTGPEVPVAAVTVLQAAAQKYGFKLNLTEYDFGGDRYLATNEVLPDSAADEMRKHNAILLGAIIRQNLVKAMFTGFETAQRFLQ